MSKSLNSTRGIRAATSSSRVLHKPPTGQSRKSQKNSNIGQSNQNASESSALTTTNVENATSSDSLSAVLTEAQEEWISLASVAAIASLNSIGTFRPSYLHGNLSNKPFFHPNASLHSVVSPSAISVLQQFQNIHSQTHSQLVSSTFTDENLISTKSSPTSVKRAGKQRNQEDDSGRIVYNLSLDAKGTGKKLDQSEVVLNALSATLKDQQQQKFFSLLNGESIPGQRKLKIRSRHEKSSSLNSSKTQFFSGNESFPFPETSPSHSPSPSPGPSREKEKHDIGHRSPFPDVNGPKAKLAVTTSAESSISSSSPGDGSGSKAAKLQHLASTSSASAPSGSSNSLPPQASSSSGSTDQWVKNFGLPRSTKDHEFMFEHGAYGIPKRHPLSSVRNASAENTGDRLSPSRDVVPSSKIHAATSLLADLFASSQSSPSSAKGEFNPFRGSDALQAALAGGSTAEGYEIQPSPNLTKNPSKQETKTKAHRMAIRGPDGRIIKERLRSVQVGEDAYFLRPDALGVADGVGGWASRPGADPALFSRLLMHFCAVELSRYDGLSAAELAADNGSLLKAWASVDAVEVMHRAWERCVRASRREGILGSSTALIGILRGEELRIANMGDCVLMVIRGGEMLFRSTEQQHSFNFPVQLGMMGDTTDTIKKHVMASQQSKERAAGEGEVASGKMEDYDAVEEVVGGETASLKNENGERNRNDTAPPVTPEKQSENEDDPVWDEPRRDAGRWTVRVKAGDIIVVGSDGLMDNLFDEDIIEEVLRFIPSNVNTEKNGEKESIKIDSANFSPQMVSEALCSRAKAVSEDSRAVSSPFQQRAMEEGLNYVGGKHDDISVLVCLVGERDGLVLDSGNEGEKVQSTGGKEGEEKGEGKG